MRFRHWGLAPLAGVLLLAGTWAGAAEGVAGLLPQPKAARAAAGRLELRPTFALAGAASPQTEYAVEALGQVLGSEPARASAKAAGVALRVAANAGELAAAAKALKLPAAPADRWQEAFVLDCGTVGGQVRLTGGLSGLIYGVYALSHLRRHDGPRLTVPRCAVSDWPTMLSRAYTGCPRDPKSPSFLSTLDWLARWRINACYYEIYGDQGQDGMPEEVAVIARECSRRGIRLYGQFSNWRTNLLLKRELCPANSEDLARVRRYAREALDRGCQGLIFLFDDITQETVEHPLHCEECKARFGSLAACQLELMRPMLEEGRRRGVKHLIACPTPYQERWENTQSGKLDGKQYYATWGASPLMQGVQVYHCDLRAKGIAALEQAGLRNYIYWCNGFYPYDQCVPDGQKIAGVWGGLAELPFGWYTCRWDAGKGLGPTPDAYEVFRELPKLTQHAWLCGGGEWPWALWGCYCWDAARFADCEPELLRIVYGAGTVEPYARYKALVRGWLPRLQSGAAIPPAQREALLAQLHADVAAVKDAATVFTQATTTAADAGLPKAARLRTGEQMLASVEALTKLAATAQTGHAVVRLEPVQDFGNGTREQRMTLGDFWSRYSLRYSQTTDPDGKKHRTQWHFGSGLGMTGPSQRNWYDAGFLDVLVNGQSLDTTTPEFAKVTGEQGDEALRATWKTEAGSLALIFGIWKGGLRISGQWTGDPAAKLAVRLFAIPGAGWGAWTDMDKYVTTPSGETPHGTPVTLKAGERWLFLADKTYDIPHEQAEGPCAVVFGEPLPTVQCDNASYVVQVDGQYPPGTTRFSLTVWDFHGLKNAEGLSTLQDIAAGPELP